MEIFSAADSTLLRPKAYPLYVSSAIFLSAPALRQALHSTAAAELLMTQQKPCYADQSAKSIFYLIQ